MSVSFCESCSTCRSELGGELGSNGGINGTSIDVVCCRAKCYYQFHDCATLEPLVYLPDPFFSLHGLNVQFYSAAFFTQRL